MLETGKSIIIDNLVKVIVLRLIGLTQNKEFKDMKLKEFDTKFNDIIGPALKKFVSEVCQ